MRKILATLIFIFTGMICVSASPADYSDDFKKFTTTDLVVVDNMVIPDNYEALDVWFYNHTKDLGVDGLNLGECNTDFTTCTVYIEDTSTDTYPRPILESHDINFVYPDGDYDLAQMIREALSNIEGETLIIDDIEIVSGYVYSTKENNIDMPGFSNDLRNALGNLSYVAEFEPYYGYGVALPFNVGGVHMLHISYDGIVYFSREVSAGISHYFYVPTETEKTTEAFVKAANDRLAKYFDTKTVYFEHVDVITNHPEYEIIVEEGNFDSTTMTDSYYRLVVGEKSYEFLIVADSSKMQDKLTHEVKDSQHNVSVETDDLSIPLDTIVETEIIEDKDILKVIEDSQYNITGAVTFDINLFSPSQNDFITETKNGQFKVTLPIPESLQGKKLVALYVTEDGKVEEHPITISENLMSFFTNHFSAYTIVEVANIENAGTSDNVIIYVILGGVSLVALLGASIYIFKKN